MGHGFPIERDNSCKAIRRSCWWRMSLTSGLFSSIFLTQQGYRVASATDFPEGNALLRSISPDLLITNVRLPNGDGRDLKTLANALSIPVLLISAHLHVPDESTGVAFLQKPFRLRELEQKVEALLKA